jgi:phosphoribosylformylglycinamidine (FGAM) synthase-like enzyme
VEPEDVEAFLALTQKNGLHLTSIGELTKKKTDLVEVI